jgi:hypothetical protein
VSYKKEKFGHSNRQAQRKYDVKMEEWSNTASSKGKPKIAGKTSKD